MADETTPLEGKVAQIVSEREIAINIGRNHGVTKGMKFAVLSAAPLQVLDPDTGEELDALDREKVLVVAREVREKITICATFRTTFYPGGLDVLSTITASSVFQPSRRVVETLRIEDSALPKPLDPEDSYVKIGDRVKQVEIPEPAGASSADESATAPLTLRGARRGQNP